MSLTAAPQMASFMPGGTPQYGLFCKSVSLSVPAVTRWASFMPGGTQWYNLRNRCRGTKQCTCQLVVSLYVPVVQALVRNYNPSPKTRQCSPKLSPGLKLKLFCSSSCLFWFIESRVAPRVGVPRTFCIVICGGRLLCHLITTK